MLNRRRDGVGNPLVHRHQTRNRLIAIDRRYFGAHRRRHLRRFVHGAHGEVKRRHIGFGE
jgi:hypothetical protein